MPGPSGKHCCLNIKQGCLVSHVGEFLVIPKGPKSDALRVGGSVPTTVIGVNTWYLPIDLPVQGTGRQELSLCHRQNDTWRWREGPRNRRLLSALPCL